MKRNAFTLIELLAVIVILAIIALIATPIVINIIDDAKENANLRSAEFYLDAVELAITKSMLNGIKVPNGTYEIMNDGSICIEIYNKDEKSCSIPPIKVDISNGPKQGTITIQNNLVTEYSLILHNDQIVTNINLTDDNCFDYIHNYDYDVNVEACKGALMAINYGDADKINKTCTSDEYGDIITLSNYNGITIQELETMWVISNVKKLETISITGYKCVGEKDVVIPSKIDNKTVTKIGTMSFSRSSENDGSIINSVVIPNTVTIIESNAFINNNLTRVIIPDSVITIGRAAFYDNNLTSVTLGDSVETIGTAAFYSNNLTNVVIPDSVITISQTAFQKNNLTSLTLGNSVDTIGLNAFSHNKLTSVIIPNSVKIIDDNAFNENKLTIVTIGNGIKNIGDSAFAKTTESIEGITYGPNVLEKVCINRDSSDVTIESNAFGWYNDVENIHWNSTCSIE